MPAAAPKKSSYHLNRWQRQRLSRKPRPSLQPSSWHPRSDGRVVAIMSLEAARCKIDEIDNQLISLLNRRAELVHEIGQIKKKDGLEIYVPGREEKLLR